MPGKTYPGILETMKTLLLLLAGLVFSGIWLFLKINDPFGAGFWIPLYSLLFLTTFVLIWVARFFLIKRKLWLKLVAAIPMILAIGVGFLLLSLIIDYRWLLPGFRKRSPSAFEWTADYESLKMELSRHPAFKDSLDEAFLTDSVPFDRLSEDESLIALMKLTAKLKDGHTYVHPLQPAIKARYLPLQGYWFDDGYFITRASTRYAHLIGHKVIAINNTPVEELLMNISPLTGSENPWQAKYKFDLYIFSANVLRGLKIIESSAEATIQTEDRSGIRTETKVISEPFFGWFFWALKPIDATELSPAKFSLRKLNYYLEVDSVRKFIFLPLHVIMNQKGDSFKSLAVRLDSIARRSNLGKIVIDLRNNLGGNNQLYGPLIEVLSKRSQTQKIYVLISRKTFSAAVNFISDLKRSTNIILVGEPTGAGPNHYGDANHLFLPETHISFFVSSRKWEFDSDDNSRFIKPDVSIVYKFSDYQRSIDPWLSGVENN